MIVVDAERISDSCGYSVPRLDFVEDRTVLDLHHAKRGDAFYLERDMDTRSIDGLPGTARS